MKVLLRKNIKALGQAGEIKNVSDGYARNYLLPHNMAVIATDTIVATQKQQQTKENQAKEKQQAKEKKALDQLANAVIGIKVKANAEGTLFSSITKQILTEAINKKLDMDLKADDINIEEAIKKVGEHEISVNINNQEQKVKVNVKNDK